VPTRARNSSLASLAEKPNSPFTPGEPVPVELFVGRQAQIEEVFRYARQASSGRVESVLLCAERGRGAYRFVNRIYPLYMYLHKAVRRNR